MTSVVVDTECVRVLRQHKSAVLNVKFNMKGDYCISTSQDKSLILWNPMKGTMIKEYCKPHNHEVNDVSITSDNARFASCGGDKIAFLWDVTTGGVIRKFTDHQGKLNCCEITASDNLLLTGGFDKIVRIWDLRTYKSFKAVQMLEECQDSVSSILITNDNRILVGSIDGCVRCYDIRKGRLHTDDFNSPIVGLSLSQDNRCYIANCLDNTIQLAELDSGQHLNVFRGHKNSNYALHAQISNDDAYVVSGSEDGRICIWDICANAQSANIAQVRLNQCYIIAQELSPENTFLCKDAQSYDQLQREGGKFADWGCVFTVRFHPAKWYFITCHNDRTLRIWKKKEVCERKVRC